MRPHEIWLHISPRHPSDSDRGWDFRPYQERRSAVWPVLAGVVCALIVCAVFSITQQG
jgi:hypothetical protein